MKKIMLFLLVSFFLPCIAMDNFNESFFYESFRLKQIPASNVLKNRLKMHGIEGDLPKPFEELIHQYADSKTSPEKIAFSMLLAESECAAVLSYNPEKTGDEKIIMSGLKTLEFMMLEAFLGSSEEKLIARAQTVLNSERVKESIYRAIGLKVDTPKQKE